MGTQRLDFAEFYRSFKDDYLRTFVVIVGDQDSAQELVAEAFARACASWRTVSRHPAPAAWVVRTALNLNISRWRRRRREVPVPDPGMLADRPAAAIAAQDPFDPQIMAALMRLPARQRQVIALRLILDLDTGGTRQADNARRAAAGLPPKTGAAAARPSPAWPPQRRHNPGATHPAAVTGPPQITQTTARRTPPGTRNNPANQAASPEPGPSREHTRHARECQSQT